MRGKGSRNSAAYLARAGDLGDAVVAMRAAWERVRGGLLILLGRSCLDSLCGEREGADDALFGEFDLEGVVLVAVRAGEGEVGGFAEGFRAGGCADEGCFGFERAPGFVGDAAECEAGGRMVVAAHLEAGGDGDEREGVALAVANLEVLGVSLRISRAGSSTAVMSSSGLRIGVELRGVAGEAMEVGDGDGPLALGPGDVDGGVERGESDVHVGGIAWRCRCWSACAVVALAEDGVVCG